MAKIIYVSNLDGVLNKVNDLFASIGKVVESSAKLLTKDYKAKIRQGKNSDGSDIEPLLDSTKTMPIRFGSERVTRPSGPPLVATGKSVDSIDYKVSGNTAEIAPISSRGALTFGENAYSSGNVNKAKRDPLTVSNDQMDIVENEILKAIDEALNVNS